MYRNILFYLEHILKIASFQRQEKSINVSSDDIIAEYEDILIDANKKYSKIVSGSDTISMYV